MITTEQFAVKNRWNGDILFTAEISVTPDMEPSRKLGLAAEWAVANNTSLREADLSGADMFNLVLGGADMRDADMSGADMRCADMSGADISGADMRGCLT